MLKKRGKPECKRLPTNSKKTYNIYFDLEATYTVCCISRLLGVSKRVALKYVNHNGTLTEKGIQVLHNINEDLCQDYGN